MKAMTIKQPWGYLICAGIKDIENRTWKTNFRGRVLIHASAKYDQRHRNMSHLFTPLQWAELEKLNLTSQVCANSFNLSAIIGSIEIVDCVQNHSSVWAEKGVWNWILANPVLLDKPIENVKGKLGFWEYEKICHICGNFTKLICEDCENYYCENCQSAYNQFTQIDYNCCKHCAETKAER